MANTATEVMRRWIRNVPQFRQQVEHAYHTTGRPADVALDGSYRDDVLGSLLLGAIEDIDWQELLDEFQHCI